MRTLTVEKTSLDLSLGSFTTRSTWHHLQRPCRDLKRVHAHLSQGTRPSKKQRGINDLRRYLKQAVIARDGLLVVCQTVPFAGARERIVIPRRLVHGVITALHLKLNHPSKYQLRQIVNRYFFALNMESVIAHVCDSCEVCVSLRDVPNEFRDQSTSVPEDTIGRNFAADVIRRAKQNILIVREDISAYRLTILIPNETASALADGLLRLLSVVRTPCNPPISVRTDPAPAFRSLQLSDTLSK